MLMYGDSSHIVDTGVIFNLCSLVEGYYRLYYLNPPVNFKQVVTEEGKEFDIMYANYVMSNDLAFFEFFNTIMYNLYFGTDVYIIVSSGQENWSENLIESLLKLIQQRYGYNAMHIVTDDDVQYAITVRPITNFNKDWGLKNLDMDKDRYSILSESYRIRSGGTINEFV